MIYKLEKEERDCCELCNDEWTTFDCPKCKGSGIHIIQDDDNPICTDCETEFIFIKKDDDYIYLKDLEHD